MTEESFKPFGPNPRVDIARLLETSREGVIDGVTFDLNHSAIPPESWHAPDGIFGVDLYFPSEAEGGEEEVSFFSEPGDQRVWAEVGDVISIAELRRFDRLEGPLVDLHDTEEWWAYLQLERRTTGERVKLEGVVCFVPRDALGPHSPHFLPDDEGHAAYVEQHVVTFKKIGLRIKRLAASTRRREPALWATVNGMRARITEGMRALLPPDTEVEHGWVYEGPFGPAREWLTLADRSQEFARDEAEAVRDETPSIDLTELLDTVAAAAYALARAECELRVAPLAKNTLKVIEGGGVGGRRSAARRREWVATNWEPHALELGQAIRAKTPSLGQTNLATEILFAWTSEIQAPGYDWTLAFIRAAERRGVIPKRLPEGGRKGVAPAI